MAEHERVVLPQPSGGETASPAARKGDSTGRVTDFSVFIFRLRTKPLRWLELSATWVEQDFRGDNQKEFV